VKRRPAIRLEVEPLRRWRGAKRLRISGWQTHFWRKRVTNVLTHSPLKPHPIRLKQIHMMKTTKISSSRKQPFHYTLCVLAIIAALWSNPAFGSDANINIINFAFTPNTASINVNDSVTWTWVGSPHTSTSDTGLWDSGVFSTGHTFTRAFTSAGSFPFHCTVHPFMTGTITVQSVHVPPTVAFTNPPNGSVLAAPASFTLSATASDSDGTVTNIEFLQGASLLGNVTTAPYSVPVRNLAAGSYAFSVVATDNGGGKATNALSLIVVTPAPIRLSAAQRVSPTTLQFSYSATIGLRYFVQRSVDLTNWIGLSTNTAAANSIVFVDQKANQNPGFYRVGVLPNP
jgi:plastocyanin